MQAFWNRWYYCAFLTSSDCRNISTHYCLCPPPILHLTHIPTPQGEINGKSSFPFCTDPQHRNPPGMLLLDLKTWEKSVSDVLPVQCARGPSGRPDHPAFCRASKYNIHARMHRWSQSRQLLYSSRSHIYLIPLPSAQNSWLCPQPLHPSLALFCTQSLHWSPWSYTCSLPHP